MSPKEKDMRKVLLEEVDRRKVPPKVRSSAVLAIKNLTNELLARKRKKTLVFYVLQNAYVDAGEKFSTQALATELDVRGKTASVAPRANLLQKRFSGESTVAFRSINITTAEELVEKRAATIDLLTHAHRREMLDMLTAIIAKNPTLREMYPQKVSNAFINLYCDINKIRAPDDVRVARSLKIERQLRHTLGDGKKK